MKRKEEQWKNMMERDGMGEGRSCEFVGVGGLVSLRDKEE